MVLAALVLVFIPFFSIPPFIFSSYVQPFTLLIGWSFIFSSFRLNLSKNLFTILASFLFYILLLKFFTARSVLPGDSGTLMAYIAGFSQLLLLFSLFKYSFSRCVYRDFDFVVRLRKALDLCALIVIISVPLQLIHPFSWILGYIKPRTILLDDSLLSESYRGLSGLMPEPSYLGTCLGTLLLSSFLLEYFCFLLNQLNYFQVASHEQSSFDSFNISNYSTFLGAYIFSHRIYLLGAFIAIFLSFSPTSFLSYLLLISTFFLPFLIQACLGIVSYVFLRYLVLFSIVLLAFALLSTFFFAQSRLVSVINFLLTPELIRFLVQDQSIADRFASSALGVFSFFRYPLGLGLNGHGYLMSDCTNDLISNLGVMCGSYFNSDRNHNAFANLTIDGGLLSVAWIYIVMSKVAFFRRFVRIPYLRNELIYSLVFLPILLLFLFVLLPAPLGSPFLWMPFAVSIAFLRVLPRMFCVHSENTL